MNLYIRGTVVANTGSWVFSFFLEIHQNKLPHIVSAIELSYISGGNEYGKYEFSKGSKQSIFCYDYR